MKVMVPSPLSIGPMPVNCWATKSSMDFPLSAVKTRFSLNSSLNVPSAKT
jgi:hypothetical protein